MNLTPFGFATNSFSFLDITQNDRDQHNFSQEQSTRQAATQIFKTKELKFLIDHRISLLIRNFFSVKMCIEKHGGIKKPLRILNPKGLNSNSLRMKQTDIIYPIKRKKPPYELYHIVGFVKNQPVFKELSI